MIKGKYKNLKIDSGLLRTPCELFAPTTTGDGVGGGITTMVSQGVFFCGVEPLGGNRTLDQVRIAYDQSFRVFMRWIDLGNGWKIEFNGKMHTIHSSNDIDNKQRWLEIICYV